MKTFKKFLHDQGTGGHSLIDILNNLTDEEIEESVKKHAQEYAQQACEDLRERIAENAKVTTTHEYLGHDPRPLEKHIVDRDSIRNVEIILP